MCVMLTAQGCRMYAAGHGYDCWVVIGKVKLGRLRKCGIGVSLSSQLRAVGRALLVCRHCLWQCQGQE